VDEFQGVIHFLHHEVPAVVHEFGVHNLLELLHFGLRMFPNLLLVQEPVEDLVFRICGLFELVLHQVHPQLLCVVVERLNQRVVLIAFDECLGAVNQLIGVHGVGPLEDRLDCLDECCVYPGLNLLLLEDRK